MSIVKKRALLFVAFALCAAIVFIVTIFAFKTAGAPKSATIRVHIQAITFMLCGVAYLFLRARLSPNPANPLAPRIGWAMLVWLIIGLLFSIIPYAIVLEAKEIHWENLRFELLYAAAIFSLSAGMFEEIFHRDMLFRWSLDRFSVATCIAIQIVTFSAMHFIGQRFSWDALMTYSIGAVLYSLLWLLTEDFLAPMLAHAIYNFTVALFNGIFTDTVARAGLLLGETSLYQIYAHQAFEVIATLVVFAAWRRKVRANLRNTNPIAPFSPLPVPTLSASPR